MSRKEELIKKITELQIKGDDLSYEQSMHIKNNMTHGNGKQGAGAMLLLYKKASEVVSDQITTLYKELDKIEEEEWKNKH